MKSINHHNTGEPPGRVMGHPSKVASSSGSSKAQKSTKKSPVNSKQNNSSTSGSTAVQEDEKDTSASNRYKNYAGISSRSVKCYWEQHNQHETECQDEVYMRVAEDVTYKLWELGNALKIYSRHTGGRVTTDLVNVVLKDMSVAPVLGASSSNWDTIDCDSDSANDGDGSAGSGSYYFNSDRVVDLREEYMKEYQMLQPGPTSVTSTWCVEDEVSEDLLDLFDKLCDAIFLGDEETFVAALEVTDSHPFICGIISLLLNKCTEMLAFDYKKATLERTMKFLVALTGNSYLDQNHVNLELYYLSQLMVSLLMGADNDKYFESLPKLTNGAIGEGELFSGDMDAQQEQQQQSDPQPGESFEAFSGIVGDLMDYTETPTGVQGVVVKSEVEEVVEGDHKLHATLFNGIDSSLAPPVAEVCPVPVHGEMKHDYEALFIMMDNGEFGMKKLEEFQIKTEPAMLTRFESEQGPATVGVPEELKQRLEVDEQQDEEEEEGDDESDALGAGEVEEEEMCVITTKMCDTEDVALVCQCMGRLAGFWSYMYRECSYLLLRRIDQFFLSGVILLKCEYEWLVRAIQAVYALGEVPFREFSTHVDKLHVTITPDWVTVHLNCFGVFLRDEQDGELYSLLYELCGDAILPFMLFRSVILKHVASTSVRSRVVRYKIVSKVVPRLLGCWEGVVHRKREKHEREDSKLESWFEDRPKHKILTGPAPRIGFKFTGCRPMPVRKKEQRERETEAHEDVEAIAKNTRRVIVAKRKLLRPLTNVQGAIARIYDLSSIHF